MEILLSQNSSQWNNTETVNGSNSLRISRSDFDPGEELFQMVMLPLNGVISQSLELVSFMKELKELSYVYNDSDLLQDTFSNSALIFIPAKQSDIVQ
jgi:hypothetical protein